jgi:hypothetical protein
MDDANRLTRLSLWYPATYLLLGGTMLMTLPRLLFTLFLSTQPEAYGDVMPRMAGALTFALGVLVVQVIRHRVVAMHATLVGLRVFLVATWVALYVYGRDRFFLVLAAIVAFGAVLTTVAMAHERDAG